MTGETKFRRCQQPLVAIGRKFWGIFLCVLCVFLAGAAFAAMSDDDFLNLCLIGTPQQVERAIKDGANVNAKRETGSTALMLAAGETSNPEVIIALINAGADIYARNKHGDRAIDFAKENENIVGTDAYRLLEGTAFVAMSDSEFTELCKTGTPQQVEAAIRGGADINAKTEHDATPLMWAVLANPNPKVVIALINAGADVNAKAEGDMTSLIAAAMESSNPEVITALINAGADVHAKTVEDKRAIDYAKDNKDIVNTDAYRQLEAASK